jgi:hypothetical protein
MAESNGRRNGQMAGMAGMAEQQKERNGGMVEWRERRYGGKNGRIAEWQKWLHTYYLRYTHTDDEEDDDDDDEDDDDTLIYYSIDKPIGPTTRKSVQGRLLHRL